MNIKITYNWLLDYLETDADAYEIQKYLSLSGPSIETVEKVEDDYVFDIEVTSNRVDMASVFGIALEAQAILPMFGKKAKLKNNPLEKYTFSKLDKEGGEKKLTVNVTKPDLCSRFTAIIISNLKIKPSPEFISKRLTMCGIKSINNIIDISNYLMLSLGQPTHTFDYDEIKNSTMIMRESKPGEKMITLDGKEMTLPGGDIVIEDGEGRLVDLCGIMGGLNSSVTDKTKNVLLFVQTYNKYKIRKTSLTTNQRTVAATFFEKGLDEERVEPTLVYGVELLKEFAEGQIDSKLYDIYPTPYEPKAIEIELNQIRKIMGVEVDEKTVTSILSNLGFKPEKISDSFYKVEIPSWRKYDVEIKEDIVEEVARVYGYYNLPNNLMPAYYTKHPKDLEMFFLLQTRLKYFLKHLGLNEVMNYSMVSKQLLEGLGFDISSHLELQNTISEEIRYFRKSLLPSLTKNMKENQGKKETLKFFEVAKVYFPKSGDLPDEKYKLGVAVNTDFFDLKGIVESIFKELRINNYKILKNSNQLFTSNIQAEILVNGKPSGVIGQLKPAFQRNMEIDKEIYLAELDFETLIKNYKVVTQYVPTNPYAVVKLDLTVKDKPDQTFEDIKRIASETSKLLTNLEIVDLYKDKLTLRFYFSKPDSNITEEEAKIELEKIKAKLSA